MSDAVQTMVSGFNEVPWHRKGKVVAGAMTAAQAIRDAGLDWEVVLRPVFVDLPSIGMQRLEDKSATVRLDNNFVLGVVGQRYRVIQNKELFGFFDPVVDRGEAIYHTAGALYEGRKVWLLAKLPEEYYVPGVPDDLIHNYILLASSHDGSLRVTIKHTPVRVVCANTLGFALNGMSDELSIKHTATAQYELSQAHVALGLATKRMGALIQAAEVLAKYQMTPVAVKVFLKELVPSQPEELGGEPSSLTEKKRDRINILFAGSEANTIKGMKYSGWAMYNAVTEWVDHDWMARKGTDRLDRAWFGTGQKLKVKAFRKLVKAAS